MGYFVRFRKKKTDKIIVKKNRVFIVQLRASIRV